jgi:hypothetical protein
MIKKSKRPSTKGNTPLDSPDDLLSKASFHEQIIGIFYPSGEQI